MTFAWPGTLPKLSLWDIACCHTGQNAQDLTPTNETRHKLAELVHAARGQKLRIEFLQPGNDHGFVTGLAGDGNRAATDADWCKLNEVIVYREDWERYQAVMNRPPSTTAWLKLHISPDEAFIAVAELGRRIAMAQVPNPQRAVVIDVVEKSVRAPKAQHSTRQPLSEGEWQLLNDIWEKAGLPDIWTATPGDVDAYKQAVKQSSSCPKWELAVTFKMLEEEAKLKRRNIENQHFWALDALAKSGEIALRNEQRMQIYSAEPGACLSIDDARKYLKPLGIELVAEADKYVGMQTYVPDPDNSWQHIGAIDLQRRDPYRELPPIFIRGWLKRDLWTRREAMLLLAGFDPDATTWGEVNGKFNTIPSGRIGYLDGTTAYQLSTMNLQHPRQPEALSDFWKLSAWSEHSSLGETRAPQQWIDWATGKSFTPYWQSFVQEDAARTKASSGTVPDKMTNILSALPDVVEKTQVLDALVNRFHGPLPDETMDGPLRKVRAPAFMAHAAPPDDLTHADRAQLELIWGLADLPWPEHPTKPEWESKYLAALRNSDERPDWTPVPTWGLNRRLAERGRDECRKHYETVLSVLQGYEADGRPASSVPATHWLAGDVKAALAAQSSPSSTSEHRVPKVSKAPPPIRPSRGGHSSPPIDSSHQSEPGNRPPCWEKWRLMGGVRVFEAVALSLNVEPGQVKTNPHAWMGAKYPFDEGSGFNDRLDVVIANLGNKEYFSTAQTEADKNYQRGVSLSEFAKFATGFAGWEVPPELAALANEQQYLPAPKQTPAPVTGAEQKAGTAAQVEGVQHSTKGKRATLLSAEIERAKKNAVGNSKNVQSIWDELVKLAEARYGCLVGYSSDGIQYRGKKYQESEVPDVFTRKQLTDRLGKARQRANNKPKAT